MKYKVGDRILCKRGIVFGYNYDLEDLEYYAGRSYKILRIDNWNNFLIAGSDEGGPAYWFDVKGVWDHFYTEQELRKKKLEKLNKI